MGKCQHCKVSMTIDDGDVVICPKCRQPPYRCNTCHLPIGGAEQILGKNIFQCVICGFFICPSCGACGEQCNAPGHVKFLESVIPEINKNQSWKIIEYFVEFYRGLVHRSCPDGVGISYAKGLNKTMALRLMGAATRTAEDRAAFERRFNEIAGAEIGTEFTIRGVRENGTHGQEYREVFNLGICLGKIQKVRVEKKSGSGKYYDKFIRVERDRCKDCNWDILEKEVEKKKRKNNIDFCNLAREMFVHEKDVIDDEDNNRSV